MKISIWLIGFIIVMLYIGIFIDIWGIYKIRILISIMLEYINNIKS